MSGKTILKTGRLVCPPQATSVVQVRRPRSAHGAVLAGKPDPQSAAQRTLHQAMLNRLIGMSPVYTHLRSFGFDVAWDWQPPTMPQTGLTLAIHQEPDGPRLGIVLRQGAGRVPFEEDLLLQGWHILVLDPSAVVQTPQDAVDAILDVLSDLGGIPFDLSNRVVGDKPDSWAVATEATAPVAPRRIAGRLEQAMQWTVLAGFLVCCLGIGLFSVSDDHTLSAQWQGGLVFRARISHISLSPDGNALVSLGNGRQAYVPARALSRNPNRLHDLILAWRTGMPLTLFTTAHQDRDYGREIGVRDVHPRPTASHSAN